MRITWSCCQHNLAVWKQSSRTPLLSWLPNDLIVSPAAALSSQRARAVAEPRFRLVQSKREQSLSWRAEGPRFRLRHLQLKKDQVVRDGFPSPVSAQRPWQSLVVSHTNTSQGPPCLASQLRWDRATLACPGRRVIKCTEMTISFAWEPENRNHLLLSDESGQNDCHRLLSHGEVHNQRLLPEPPKHPVLVISTKAFNAFLMSHSGSVEEDWPMTQNACGHC